MGCRIGTATIADDFLVRQNSLDLIVDKVKLEFSWLIEKNKSTAMSNNQPATSSGSDSNLSLLASSMFLISDYWYLLVRSSTQTGSSMPALQNVAQIATKRPRWDAGFHSTQAKSASKQHCPAAQEQQLASLLPKTNLPSSSKPSIPSGSQATDTLIEVKRIAIDGNASAAQLVRDVAQRKPHSSSPDGTSHFSLVVS